MNSAPFCAVLVRLSSESYRQKVETHCALLRHPLDSCIRLDYVLFFPLPCLHRANYFSTSKETTNLRFVILLAPALPLTLYQKLSIPAAQQIKPGSRRRATDKRKLTFRFSLSDRWHHARCLHSRWQLRSASSSLSVTSDFLFRVGEVVARAVPNDRCRYMCLRQ